MKQILLYSVDERKNKRIREALKDLDIVIRNIDNSYLNMTIKDIFDGNKNNDNISEQNVDPIFKNEFMLVDGFDDESLRDLIFRFKSNIIARPITSVRTQSNQEWPLKELLQEIFLENEYMKKMSDGQK